MRTSSKANRRERVLGMTSIDLEEKSKYMQKWALVYYEQLSIAPNKLRIGQDEAATEKDTFFLII